MFIEAYYEITLCDMMKIPKFVDCVVNDFDIYKL